MDIAKVLNLYYNKIFFKCSELKEPFSQFAREMKKIDDPKVLVAGVDCVDNRALCDKYDVKGYPTI